MILKAKSDNRYLKYKVHLTNVTKIYFPAPETLEIENKLKRPKNINAEQLWFKSPEQSNS